MKTRICARGLLVAAVSVMALMCGTGAAHADSDPFGTPGLIDQLVTSTPALSVDPTDEGGSSMGSDAVGMYCENRFARCH